MLRMELKKYRERIGETDRSTITTEISTPLSQYLIEQADRKLKGKGKLGQYCHPAALIDILELSTLNTRTHID